MSHPKGVSGSKEVSPSKLLLLVSGCDRLVPMMLANPTPGNLGLAAPLVNSALGGRRPGSERTRLTFCRPLDPPACSSLLSPPELPATQVSSCCNKLLLTQDYCSFQIPPREQGNKPSLPGLCPSCSCLVIPSSICLSCELHLGGLPGQLGYPGPLRSQA